MSPDQASLRKRLPDLLTDPALSALVVRGAQGSGRTTLLGAAAATLALDVLVYDGELTGPSWPVFEALALLAPVLPVVRVAPGPGETLRLPPFRVPDRPLGVVCGRSGGLAGPPLEHGLTLNARAGGPRGAAAAVGGRRCRRPDTPTSTRSSSGSCSRPATSAGRRRSPVCRPRPRAGVWSWPTTCARPSRTLRRQELETLATFLDPLPASARPVSDPPPSRSSRRCCCAADTASGSPSAAAPTGTQPRGPCPVQRAERHRQDPRRPPPGRRPRSGPLPRRPGRRGQQVHRRDRAQPRPRPRPRRGARRRPAARRGRRADDPAYRRRRRPTTATPTSRRTSCCSGWRPSTASSSSPSNAAGRIDPAFLRRIDVTVDFVPPDAAAAPPDLGRPPARRPRRGPRPARRGRAPLRAHRRADPQRRRPRARCSPSTRTVRSVRRRLSTPYAASTSAPGPRSPLPRHVATLPSGTAVKDLCHGRGTTCARRLTARL